MNHQKADIIRYCCYADLFADSSPFIPFVLLLLLLISGMTFQLELSTKPAKALGDDALWEEVKNLMYPLHLLATSCRTTTTTTTSCAVVVLVVFSHHLIYLSISRGVTTITDR